MCPNQKLRGLNRRTFLKGSMVGLIGLPALKFAGRPRAASTQVSKVALIKTDDRKTGVREALKLFDYAPITGKQVYIKPNFNTADPTPGSTHNDVLSELVKAAHDQGAKTVTVGDRSGPQPTAEVLTAKGIPDLAKELEFELLNFSELPQSDWMPQNPEGNHWKDGFMFARQALESEYTISTCCLKTHGFGGVFTLSLKLSVGLVPREQMRELHSSLHQRRMIAEINSVYQPELIVLDGIEAFVDKGPMEGPRKTANVFLAGRDRVAVDAVGVAVLKELGSNPAIMETKIFEQEQIKRAAELGLGVGSPDQIEFVTADREGKLYADKLKTILAKG
ncbi:MAG: DUF362 domain-containing protein [Candidatus Aminicenantaceae bacterium]